MEFYKPNANGSGHLIGLQFNSKEKKLYAQFVKQTSWDAANHVGSFKGGAKFNITLAEREIGVLLNCIERGITEKLFHKSAKGNTSIEVKPYLQKVRTEEVDENKKPIYKELANGFIISASPRANEGEEKPQQFGFWFDKHEARVFRSYLEFVLHHFNCADYSEDKKRRQDAKKTGAPASEETGF